MAGNPGQNTGYDAVVVGSGPNGLAAALTLADAGQRVLVLEARDTIGGGARTSALTLPGFRHDMCSTVHPLGVGSPFFQRAKLERYGLRWVHPPMPLAHPLDGGRAVGLYRSPAATAASLGEDGRAWRRLMGQPARDWARLAPVLLATRPWPRHPWTLARFGLAAIWPAETLATRIFSRATGTGVVCRTCCPFAVTTGRAADGIVRLGDGAVGPCRRLAGRSQRFAGDCRCTGRRDHRPPRRDRHRTPGIFSV